MKVSVHEASSAAALFETLVFEAQADYDSAILYFEMQS